MAEINRGRSYDFVEKLWATRRVGDLIDQIDLHGQNKELVDELVALSTRYGILTPYTSFLADETRAAPRPGREPRPRRRAALRPERGQRARRASASAASSRG